MGISHFLHFYNTSSPVSRRIHHLSAFSVVTPFFRRYSKPSKDSHNDHGIERAPTTAQVFERVAEEFEKVAEAKARQGFAGHTSEKAHDDCTDEAARVDSRVESAVKEGNYKQDRQ